MLERALLARYLRQRAELGEREVMLEGLTAAELLGLLSARPAAAEGASAGQREGARRGGAMAQGRARSAGRGATAAGGGPEASLLDPASRAAMIREVLAPAGAAAPNAAPKSSPALRDAPDPSRQSAIAPSATGAEAPAAARALSVLGGEAAGCTACRLHVERRSVVFGEGNPNARLVIVGEAPGQEEDRTGRPFVGQAGKLLNLLLMTAGFPRDEVYICNTLKCRPPQNRNPLPDELSACSSFLKGQLAAIAPKVLLAVGKFAAQTLAGSEENISRLRGRVFTYEGIPLIVSYHPAFLLRSPQWTRTAWEDFQLARKVLDEQA